MAESFEYQVYLLGCTPVLPTGPWHMLDWVLRVIGRGDNHTLELTTQEASCLAFEGVQCCITDGDRSVYTTNRRTEPEVIAKALVAIKNNPDYYHVRSLADKMARLIGPLPPVYISPEVQAAVARIKQHQQALKEHEAAITTETKKLVEQLNVPYQVAAWKGQDLETCPRSPIGISVNMGQGCIFCGKWQCNA